MNPNKLDVDNTVSTLKKNPKSGKAVTSTLPIPKQSANSGKPSRVVVTLAISFWALIIFGTIAGLLTTVGNAKTEKNSAALIRQNAYQALLPILDIVDQDGGTNREDTLQLALKKINDEVLTIDPKHPIAIQTKDEIQDELDQIKAVRIDEQSQTISQQTKTLDESKSQIEQLLAQMQQLESAHAALQANHKDLLASNQSLEKEKNAIVSERNRLENADSQIKEQKKILESSNDWFRSECEKLKSINNWYISANKKLESSNKWLTGEKSKLSREISSLKNKLSCAYSDYAKRLRSKDYEIASLKRQIAALKSPRCVTFQQSR